MGRSKSIGSSVCCGIVLAFLIAPWSVPSSALVLTSADQERGIFTEAVSAESADFDSDWDPAEATDLLPYAASVTSSAATTNGTASATALIDSTSGVDSISGSGSASASASALAVDVLTRAPADSHFEIVFSPDVAQSVGFVGRIETNKQGALADAHTRIELANATTGAVLASYSGGLGADLVFGEPVAIDPANSYRLSATSLAYAVVDDVVESSSADASYVVYVPEPAFALQIASGWLGLFGLHGLRQRGARRRMLGEIRC